ncbi:MAG: hypothetical protein MJY81_03270 [Bacteroidaceae bacterium]|nr:hypothetical protein [Bacteroidaceae bacterium]
MENKIQQLTDKLLSEGVEKGKAEAAKIIADANAESENIIANAKQKADDIIAQAKKDAEALNKNTRSELQMFAGQAESALKTQLTNVLTDCSVAEVVKKITVDKDFMNQFILKLAQSWGTQEDIVISTSDAASLKALFAKEAQVLLDKGVKIEEVNGQKALFTVQPADGSYKVNFGEEEFKSYFKSFLRPQLVEMLF